ncbi:phage major tail tube protein [Moraxella atlantae]|uniref:Phage major tail tube protein n=1 Tax=Faucicola atlantae TaxID=34059 RepID=A0A378Q793_9GAMM|nr:phage major tail tube protein [Moraxella atlantae]OPH35170.1 phage major tail tube protein [Moraxella atlantae]STY95067.1 phage major tail tube protein [Moraxella atlantae]
MAKQLPATLKNFNVFVDGDSYAGTAKTIELPEITKKTEDYRAAGMIGEIALDVGFEQMKCTITYTGVDSRHIAQLSKCSVNDLPIRYVGAYERQDICEHVVREVYMRGSATSLKLGEMELGNINEQEIEYTVTYLRIVDDGVQLLEIDVVNGVYIVGGVDKTSQINNLLGL